MLSRTTLFLDRLATLVLALLLLAGGAAALLWWSGRAVSGFSFPDTSDTSAVSDVVTTTGFAWAAAAAGVVLALVGLRWILAHVTGSGVKHLALAGSDDRGRLEADAGKVAGAAAAALTDTVGVRSAHGSVVRDRGQLVARIRASIEPEADLALVTRRADEVSAQLATALGRDDLRCTVDLGVARRGKPLPRAV